MVEVMYEKNFRALDNFDGHENYKWSVMWLAERGR